MKTLFSALCLTIALIFVQVVTTPGWAEPTNAGVTTGAKNVGQPNP